MKKRRLGAGGPLVSAIGLGCWSFAGSYGPTTEEESHATLRRALELGIDFLDTADVYGHGVSEQVIGSFVKANKPNFTIATKGGIKRKPGSTERTFDNSPEYLRSTLEGSLRRLNVDHVALYYVHRRDPSRPIEDVVETLAGFIKEGKIGGFGFSEISPASLRRAHAVHPVTAVQSEYSLWSRQPDLGMVQACRELGVAFVPFSPLGRGFLTGTVMRNDNFSAGDFRITNPRFIEPDFSLNKAALQPFLTLAHEYRVTPAQLAIAWILAQGDHMLPIPGTRSVAHLNDLAGAASLTLSAAQLAEIERALPPGFAHGDRYSENQWLGAERYG
jgi:aryl-alcohol dehydrogenase-like predicted oxidoreductase